MEIEYSFCPTALVAYSNVSRTLHFFPYKKSPPQKIPIEKHESSLMKKY